MAQENREPVSDQDFFSQYLQPTGTPATGDDPATPLPSNDDARDDGGDPPLNGGSAVPQADPFGAEATLPTAGPSMPDTGFDSGNPAAAYPAPPATSTPPPTADPGYTSTHRTPDTYTAAPLPPAPGFDGGPAAYPQASTPPWIADAEYDSGYPAAAQSAPPAAGAPPPWGADPRYDSTHRPPDPHPAPPPAGYPTPRQPGDQSTARHAQPPGPSYQHTAGNADAYSGSQRGYTNPAPRHMPTPPPQGPYEPHDGSPRPEPTERPTWQSGPPAGYPGGPAPQSPPPPAARPGSFGGPGQRHESVGAMQSQVREADFVTPYKQVPERGWRRKVYQTTRINLGLSPAEREWNDLRRRLTVNLRGTYTIAVLQQKGGVSKTTTTVGIGAALARYRDDKVVAIDANPASGNLAKRINEPSTGTWRGLLMDQNLHSYSDFRHYLGKDSSSGLEVLAGDPGDEVITGHALAMTWQRLSRQYPIALLDCGNQMRDDVIAAVLSMADVVVIPTTTRYDGAEAARETLDWLMQHGYPHLVRSAVMVVSNVNKVTPTKAVRNLHEGFERAVRAVHDIPYDPHLSDATAINFDRLAPQTQRAFIETAASIVDGFAGAADKDPGYRPQWPTPGHEYGQERR